MSASASRVGVHELLTMFDHVLEERGFGIDHWHSLLWNLHNVRTDHWDMHPPRGGRTIRELVMHIGKSWLLYSSRSFRDEDRAWDDASIDGIEPGYTRDEMITWLRRAHRELRNDIAQITDDELAAKRPAPWEEPYETRRLIELQIQHTIYHTGEINHLRALLQGNDNWNHQDIGREEAQPIPLTGD